MTGRYGVDAAPGTVMGKDLHLIREPGRVAVCTVKQTFKVDYTVDTCGATCINKPSDAVVSVPCPVCCPPV